MKSYKQLHLTALMLLTLSAASCAAAEDAVKPQFDIVYKTTPQGVLRLDLHYPSTATSGTVFPLVMFTHGGGWSAGDRSVKSGVRKLGVTALTDLGFCVASVDYRLCSKENGVRIRDCVTDAKDALRFLAINAERFSLDANRVSTFGDSAGGQIAQMLLLSSMESFPGDPDLVDAKYRLISGVSWYGPCDFEKTELFAAEDNEKSRDRFGGRILPSDADPQAKLAAYREVSPVNYLRPDSPPLLMIQGDMDTTIPVHHAHYMKKRADAIGASVEILIVQNAGHNWTKAGDALSPTLQEITAKTALFIQQRVEKSR